jgi:hypothetical protein
MRSIAPIFLSAVVVLGIALPSRAAGGLEDMSFSGQFFLCAAIFTPPALVGLALSNLTLGQITSFGAALWVAAWLWMVYEKGIVGAFERTGAFFVIMAFLSLPSFVGWAAGRMRRRARVTSHPELRHGK